jgi:galactokinase
VKTFEQLYGGPSQATGRASGRVNLIGEHTDYNGGLVLPTAVRRRTLVEIAPTPGRRVSVWSGQFSRDAAPFTYDLGQERVRHEWTDYVQGITDVLLRSGHAVPAFLARIESDVPPGSGLSSSAALEMALLRALSHFVPIPQHPAQVARLGQRAENEFVGAPVGIMDQLAALLGTPEAALYIDVRAMQWDSIPIPAEASLLVLNSGIRHDHAAGDYAQRRAECERAAELLGIKQLRDADPGALRRIEALPAPLDRRARHVVTENARVADFAEALRQGNLSRCGTLLNAAHQSLSSDFEVSLPAIDTMVAIAQACDGVLGARLTGGGFGGCIVVLARTDHHAAIAQFLLHRMRAATGQDVTLVQ